MRLAESQMEGLAARESSVYYISPLATGGLVQPMGAPAPLVSVIRCTLCHTEVG